MGYSRGGTKEQVAMYDLRHADGSSDDGAEDDDDMQVALSRLYDELLPSDQEHGDVSVVHETGWCMSAHWSCPDLADRFDCLNQLGALVSNSIGDT